MNIELPIRPCKDSDACIGLYFNRYNPVDIIYGKFIVGLYFGKYSVWFSMKNGFGFCDYFATGLGG